MASVSRDTHDPAPRRPAFTGILPWAAVALIALLAALLFTSHLAATSPGSGKSHTLPACLSTFTPTPAVYPQGTPTSAPGATPAPTNTATTSSGSVHKTLAPSPTDCAPPPTNTPGATPTPADKPGPTPTPKVYP